METPGNEDRIVPETGPADSRKGDGAGTDPLKCPDLPSADRHRQGADKPGLTAGFRNLRKETHQLHDVRRGILDGTGEAGRPDAGAPSQRPDLKAGILRQDRKDRGPGDGNGLLEGIGPEGGAVLFH